jgi:hypothetical protein
MMGLTGQLGLAKSTFSEFCENVKMLEFYGILKAMANPKNIHASKVVNGLTL